jgi:hypothetical protein
VGKSSIKKEVVVEREVVYCRDQIDTGYRIDVNRLMDDMYGHSEHDYETHSIFGLFRRYFHCPGVIHSHDWERIGIIAIRGHANVVEKCDCGVERVRSVRKNP